VTVNLHFAQISDIHISSLGDHHDMLSGRSADFLADIFAELNQMEDLDFVLITGDLFDTAHWQEFYRFQQVIRTLQKPYHIIPGNHDRCSLDSTQGLTHRQFVHYFNPQVEARPTAPEAQTGYWSITVKPNVHLVGLDSIRDKDWGGIIDAIQVEWLESELVKHAEKLIILAIHHPLHILAPIDHHPAWTNFVCDNGSEMLALLDRYPQVKVVLTGHHHMAKVDTVGQRLHLACPAVGIYPCAYRTLRLSQHASNGTWSLEWQTHPATDEATIAEARERMIETGLKVGGFELGFIMEHVHLALGSEKDRKGKAELG
jgi:Icc protein